MSGPEDQRHDGEQAEQAALSVGGEITEADRQKPTGLQRLQRLLHKYPWLAPLVFLSVMLVIFSVSFQGQNTLKCFTYLTAFSLGLAAVLIAIASSMVLGKKALIRSSTPSPRVKKALQILPIVSCALICLVGLILCYQAYDPGWLGISSKLLGNF